MKRPVGVTILAILTILSALSLAIIGIGCFLAGPLIEQVLQDPELAVIVEQVPPDVIELFPKVLGVTFLVMAFANVAIAFGLWTLRAWSWYLTLIFQGLGIFSNLGGLLLLSPISLVSIAFSGFYLYYFLQPTVQTAFGIRNAF